MLSYLLYTIYPICLSMMLLTPSEHLVVIFVRIEDMALAAAVVASMVMENIVRNQMFFFSLHCDIWFVWKQYKKRVLIQYHGPIGCCKVIILQPTAYCPPPEALQKST